MSDLHQDGRRIDLDVTTSADTDAAFEAWASPEGIARWFVDRARGHAARDEVVTWIFERFGYEIPYRVVEAVPGERLVLGPVEGAPPFVLEVVLTRAGGDTRIRLVNSGFGVGPESDEDFRGIVSGWQMALGLLVHHLERHPGRDRSTFFALRPAPLGDQADARPWYVEPGRLTRWLGAADRPLERVGQEVRLDLVGGGALSGRILALTPSEVALEWREEEGALQLKAFRMGEHRMVAVHGSLWGGDAERAAKLEHRFAARLEALTVALGG